MDLAVVGLGALGAATLRAAARAGARCVGIDAREPGHSEGSSHGGSRIIRRALFEHPDYVTIVGRAYELWREPESSSRRQIQALSGADAAARFPGFRLPDDFQLLWDPDGGILRPEEAVRAQVEDAVVRGAELRVGATVSRWRFDGQVFELEVEGRTIRADRLALCPGPWAGGLLGLELPLRLLQKVLLWFRPDDARWDLGNTPVFAFESGESLLYGFPALDGRGAKIADHGGGELVIDPHREEGAGEEDERIRALGQRFLTGLGEQPRERATCLYTSTPDGHPVLGEHPGWPGCFIAAGFSGHGFKHSIAFGEALASLALAGKATLPLGLFDPGRFGADV